MKKLILPFLLISSLALGKITVIEHTQKSEKGNVSFDYTYPEFQLNGKSLNNLNKKVRKEMFLLENPDYNDSAFKENSNFKEFKNNYNVTSVVINVMSYTGGGQGISTIRSLNIDNETGKELAFNDLFKNGFKEKLEKEITEKIKKDNANKEEFLSEVDLNDAIFYFEGDNLVIEFQNYAISPDLNENLKFKFSNQEMKQYMKF